MYSLYIVVRLIGISSNIYVVTCTSEIIHIIMKDLWLHVTCRFIFDNAQFGVKYHMERYNDIDNNVITMYPYYCHASPNGSSC